jgi:protein O-GlcNAc transferase
VAAKNEHIRRSALADLFLDTPLCNAHTTGTDVLWAGLPMVTLPLEKMATRVAMSLCHAAGCGEEMVVSSMQEYEERAVMLATHPTMLRALTSKLRSGRLSCPLFDTTRWVMCCSKSLSSTSGNSLKSFALCWLNILTL